MCIHDKETQLYHERDRLCIPIHGLARSIDAAFFVPFVRSRSAELLVQL